jgi:ABC-type nickel/cobalt efflux system permease component RcnA
MMITERNQPCPCGSGKKYKVCCATKRTPTQWLAIGSVVVLALLAVWVMAEKAATESPEGKEWSEEHGHWHDAANPEGELIQQGGPAPPGKVWSAEHSHWHDASTGSEWGSTEPAGPAPPGKVWSEEHGHWHDAATVAAEGFGTADADPAGPAPPGKVWSAEHGHWHDDDGALPQLPPPDLEPLPEFQTSDGS